METISEIHSRLRSLPILDSLLSMLDSFLDFASCCMRKEIKKSSSYLVQINKMKMKSFEITPLADVCGLSFMLLNSICHNIWYQDDIGFLGIHWRCPALRTANCHGMGVYRTGAC
jgi:hypothetical protein